MWLELLFFFFFFFWLELLIRLFVSVLTGDGARRKGFLLHQTRKLLSPVTSIGTDKWTLACCSC